MQILRRAAARTTSQGAGPLVPTAPDVSVATEV